VELQSGHLFLFLLPLKKQENPSWLSDSSYVSKSTAPRYVCAHPITGSPVEELGVQNLPVLTICLNFLNLKMKRSAISLR